MSEQAKKQSSFLGQPISTARSRLVKMIMFDLVKKSNLDNCFRCHEKIISIDDLSIEHKMPWLYVDQQLFWDLDNIAFSHLDCNTVARRYPSSKKTACCNGHEFTDENVYRYKDGTRECIKCRKDRRKLDSRINHSAIKPSPG